MYRRSFGQHVRCVMQGEQSSPLLMGNPCHGESGPYLPALTFTNPHSTLLLVPVIKESEHFGATDLTG
jgi:hypothetical protein